MSDPLTLYPDLVQYNDPSDANTTVAGYAHTYFDCNRINLQQLLIFPTDAEIITATKES